MQIAPQHPTAVDTSTHSPWRLCVAPMMDWTDRHCRYFHRLLSNDARLYTEMVVAQAAIHGDRPRLLGFDRAEHPVALQLGGSDAALLAQAAKIGEDFGYDEINLNCGCPSDRVQSGRFGACLMLEPAHVRDLVGAMRNAVQVPVTVKCRLGVDDVDDYDQFRRFVDVVSESGVSVFIVHARKAWLKGLSPKENREKPPLWYDRVHRLKQERPELTVVLNGGLDTVAACSGALNGDQGTALDGVMLGRAAYHSPHILAKLQTALFESSAATTVDVIAAMQSYIEHQAAAGCAPRHITKHMTGLIEGIHGAKRWRQAMAAGDAPWTSWQALTAAA